MAFTSFHFWIIFPFIFTFYWVIPSELPRLRSLFLLLLGYWLYSLWNPFFLLVLIYVTVTTYLGAYLLTLFNDNLRKKTILVLGLLSSVSPLFLFKYYNFINTNIQYALEYIGVSFGLPGLNLAIPIGLSFFTFQAISYFVDVYSGKKEVEKSFLYYSLFVSFFPQIMSGPISRASNLLTQLKEQRSFGEEKAKEGIKLLIWGIFLKLVIADRLGLCVENIYMRYTHLSGITVFLGSIFYSLQIYADFSGYSYMAIGISKLLNIDLINNFRQPYFANSVSDFWRRWHISLSGWLRDYIYIPLGGSRCSKKRNYINIILTFLVSGIWHGANWNFIIWGLFHGFAQVVEKYLGLNNTTKYKLLRISCTFLFVNFAWVFFHNESLLLSFDFISHMFVRGSFDIGTVGLTSLSILGISLVIMLTRDIFNEFYSGLRISNNISFIIYSILLIFILTVGVLDNSTFIYQNF